MDKLPEQLTTEILGRLPTTESVSHCKLVCKQWKTILAWKKIGLLFSASSEFFVGDDVTHLFYRERVREEDYITIANNFKNHPVNGGMKLTLNPIVGSCNGLVCLYDFQDCVQDPILLMNPATGESLILPKIDSRPRPRTGSRTFDVIGGFGYCEATNEYKVIRIKADGSVEIFTLGDKRGWRVIIEVPYVFMKSGLYANGCIFWFVNDHSYRNSLISFDLDTEKFQFYMTPPYNQVPEGFYINDYPEVEMMLFGSTLCIYCKHVDVTNKVVRIDFWIENKNKNPEVTWKRESSIFLEYQDIWPVFTPLAIGSNDNLFKNILLWDHHQLSCYNTETGTLKEVWRPCPLQARIQIVPHMMINVSLKDFGGYSGGLNNKVRFLKD